MAKKNLERMDRAMGFAKGTLGKGAKLLSSSLGLPGISGTNNSTRRIEPGTSSSIEHFENIAVPPQPGTVIITYIDSLLSG